MSRNASTRRSTRLSTLALVAAAAAALPLANAAIASAATPAPAPLAASSTTASSTTASYAFTLSSHTAAFGNRNLGTTSTKKVTFTNTGSKALHPVQVLSGSSSVKLGSSTCASATVNPGATCSYAITFKPTVAGAASGSLTVLSLEGTPAQKVAISGTGVRQVMEHFFYQYSFTNPPLINGVAAPQSFVGDGDAPAGTYTAGQTMAVYDVTGLNQIGTYRIGAVDNTVTLDSALLNKVHVNEYDWGTNRYTQATGLLEVPGSTGLGSEAGQLSGIGSFTDQHPAVVPQHW